MALTELQQVFELVQKSRRILIVAKQDWNGDAISGSLALRAFLKKRGKEADIVCQDFKPTANLSYLSLSAIEPRLHLAQQFVISVDLADKGLGDFSFDENGNKLNLYVTPKTGQIGGENISYAPGSFRYDLIMLVNVPDLASLGQAYAGNSDLFYSLPKVCFDHSAQNEYYANINFVDIAASSSSELVYDFIRQFDDTLIDEDIATYILSGLISATRNFKTNSVTPKTLNLAGTLIGMGARRDQIIQSLYQSRFLSTLKLWGRVLSRLNSGLNDKVIWSALSAADFLETSTSSDELPDVVEELISTMPKTEVIVLLHEERRGALSDIKVAVYAAKNRDALFIVRRFNPGGSKETAHFTLVNQPLAEAERLVIEEVKKQLT